MFPLIALACSLAAFPFDPVPADKPPTEPRRDPETPAELLNAYRYYGLPLPPWGSYLAKYTTIHRKPDANDKVTFETAEELAFITDSAMKRKRPMRRPVEPTRDLILKEILPIDFFTRGYEPRNWLCFSAQAQSLGWKEAAGAAFERGRKDPELRDLETPTPTPILNWLKETAWQYHGPKLLEPGSNHRDILRKLERTLLADDGVDRDVQLRLLDDLRRSVRSEWHRISPADDVIDEIVAGRKTKDDLIALGFDAVPAMIRHLKDRRLIREETGFEASPFRLFSCTNRVDQMCRVLLKDISGLDFLRHLKSWHSPGTVRGEADYLGREAAEWFHIATRIGEKKWCLDRVLLHNRENNISHCNEILLSIIRRVPASKSQEILARP